MSYLQRQKARPEPGDLSPAEQRFVQNTFDPYAGEVIIENQAIPWNAIDEIEIALAPRAAGPAGWLVRYLVHGEARYHVGLFFGREEAILPNVTLNVARYVAQCVAYYAPQPIRYNGPADLLPLAED